MRPFIVLALALAVVGAGPAGADPPVALTPDLAAGEWKPLIDALASKGAVEASFTESRYFPFRAEATVLTGTLRISPDRGLSLGYTKPEVSTLIADSSGLLSRDSEGRSREMPSGSRQGGAIASLLPIMSFDMKALFPQFDIRAQRTGMDWAFEFAPRDPQTASSLGTITVSGTGSQVRHLEFRRSQRQRIEIETQETRSGFSFTPGELASYFR
jgi:hypothetical protein